ncbi:MAG: cbb3-type cytochrome c oxidase subunit II [Verrucomicrobiota bacterium]
MNRGPFIFIGAFILIASTWALLVQLPVMQGGNLEAYEVDGVLQPDALPGLAQKGREVYQELGCVQCHTQQVRLTSGSDLARNWGSRQSVARDYIGEEVAFLGSVRIGPDLSNVGYRRPDPDWHLRHFYNPRMVLEGTRNYSFSNMPSFSFLYDKREIVGEPSDKALKLEGEYAVEEGYEVVPSLKAEALVAYMLSLKVDYDLPEAPDPVKIDPAR